MTKNDVIEALRIYHDIPTMIAEEWATIRNCEEQRDSVGMSAAKLREVTKESSGRYADKTARLATSDKDSLFQQEIDERLEHINKLRCTREWLRTALGQISRQDRIILDLAYIGPQEAVQRHGWHGKRWKDIAPEVHLSSRTVRRRVEKMLEEIRAEKEKDDGTENA